MVFQEDHQISGLAPHPPPRVPELTHPHKNEAGKWWGASNLLRHDIRIAVSRQCG